MVAGGVVVLIRWRGGGTAWGPVQIEIDLAEGRAVVVHEGPCYPSTPACDWNAWERTLTSTTAPNPPKHGLKPMAERAIADVESHKPWIGVSMVAGGGVGSQRIAQASLEGGTPHGHRSSGPWSLAADGDQSQTGPGRPYRPGWRIDRSGGRLSAHSQAKLTGGGVEEAEEVSMREPVRKKVSIRGAMVGDKWSTTMEKKTSGLPRQGAAGALE